MKASDFELIGSTIGKAVRLQLAERDSRIAELERQVAALEKKIELLTMQRDGS